MPAAGTGPAADPGRRRGRQYPERQQQRLLPGQRNRLGRLGKPQSRSRRPHRFRRPHDDFAKTLPANPLASLARWTSRRRILRRVVADAVGRRDEGAGLEFSREPLSCLCARARRARACADLHRAERRARGDRVQIAENAGVQVLAAAVEHDGQQTGDRGFRIRKRGERASPLGTGFRGFNMNEWHFGATPTTKGTSFRLWAPAAKRVDLLLEERSCPLRRGQDGWFSGDIAGVTAGARYKFRIDDEIDVPDPASAFQPDDVSGPSEVIDHAAHRWRATNWRGRPWQEAVVLESHVGSFTPEGTYRAMIGRLDHLVATGVTALELMPLADFAGRRNWGYDGVLWYAPDSAYGRPDDLKALIDEAHLRGLMVFLDVVYNHFGPEGNYLGRYAPGFFTEAQTPWGRAIDYRVPEVRAFAIENALYWLREYRFDGLRLDAVHTITELGEISMLHDLSRVVGDLAAETDRHIHLVLENDDNRVSVLDAEQDPPRGKYRAQWNDDYHHAWHVLLTGETQGYYGDYQRSPRGDLARALSSGFVYQGEAAAFWGGKLRGEPSGALPPSAFVNFLQNHDQIGNRALGDRLEGHVDPRAIEAALAITLLAPM